jgi:NAD(P)-dependent dehydrogenase (short-subunit alcohol dehydrogenase family)
MVAAVADRGGKAEFEALDIRDDEAVDGFMDGIVERHGRIDVLINNAGGQFLSPAEAITPKGFRTVIELNVQGTWQMTHAAATKAFIPQGEGKVVSITVPPHLGFQGLVQTGAYRRAWTCRFGTASTPGFRRKCGRLARLTRTSRSVMTARRRGISSIAIRKVGGAVARCAHRSTAWAGNFR